MKILFKDENMIYFINSLDTLTSTPISADDDIEDIPHLGDIKALYHYKDRYDNRYAVYYEYHKRIITDSYGYRCYTWDHIYPSYIKDYTLINLKLLENEETI